RSGPAAAAGRSHRRCHHRGHRMRLTRCHVALPLQPGTTVVLPERAANHLARVLRLREGEACVLFNGDGHDYAARLASVGKREVSAEVVSASTVDNEAPLRIVRL